MESNEYQELIRLAARSSREPLLSALLFLMSMSCNDKDLRLMRELLIIENEREKKA